MKTLMLLCSLMTLVSAADMKGQVVGVKAGDALEILSGGQVYSVKIHGIGAPARGESFGKASRRFAADLAFMAEVRLALVEAGSEGSFYGKVTLADGRDLAAEMVKHGMAWWNGQAGNEGLALARLEQDARDAYLGLWATPEEESDTDWRKEILATRGTGRTLGGLLSAN